MNELSKNYDLVNYDLYNELRSNSYYEPFAKLQKYIHSKIPKHYFDLNKIAKSEIREEFFIDDNYKRIVFFLLTNGCEWALKTAHGCTMCGHLGKQARLQENISDKFIINQFFSEFDKANFKETPLVNLYNNGSFFNENEIPEKSRIEILKKIGSNPDIKMLVVESRPEFITEQKVMEIRNLLPDRHVEIAIGLEVYNDFVRQLCLNKGFTLKSFENAAKIIQKYVNLRTYVFLKPILIPEKESILEAIRTIKYLFSIGCTTVSLEACTIQNYTMTKFLYDNNMYSTPWLWSIIEVVKACHHLGKVQIGMFQFYPSPEKVPYNCDNCSGHIMEMMKKYNATLDFSYLENLDCDCKNKWKNQVENEKINFEENIEKLISKIDQLSLTAV